MERNGYDFPVLVDDANATSSAYGVGGIPSRFVIGRDGRIVWNCVRARLVKSDPSLSLRQAALRSAAIVPFVHMRDSPWRMQRHRKPSNESTVCPGRLGPNGS
jgi:hypothetical protein